MTHMLHCPFCHQAAEGLTLYSVAGVFRMLVCPACYALLVSKEHQPYSTPMQRLRRLLGLRSRITRREVVAHGYGVARQPVAGRGRAAAAHGLVECRAVRSALAIRGRMGAYQQEVKDARASR
jgi:hypothetical protein